MAVLTVSTLGVVDFRWNGVSVGLGNGKPTALLVYLMLEGGMHGRETLADLLWPALDMTQARHNLRQAVYQIQRTLFTASGQDFFRTSRTHLGMAPQASYRVDAATFDAAIAGDGGTMSGLLEAADLYQGVFLENLFLTDAPSFETWLETRREILCRRALGVFSSLADHFEQSGNFQRALHFARLYAKHDPWNEVGYLRIMKLHVKLGQPGAALAEYEVCRRVLDRELGVLPGEALQAFVRDLAADGATPMVDLSVPMRRQVTVLYCELKVAEALDPEDVMAQVGPAQEHCETFIRQYGGHVVRVFGGGLLAYFGYPQAAEHSALAAVRAARAMAFRMPSGTAVRIGIHCGMVVTSAASGQPDPIGATSSTAIRLHRHARDEDVVVSAETQKRLAGHYLFDRVESGRGREADGYRVVKEAGTDYPLTALARLTPLVGRDREMADLAAAWDRAVSGTFGVLSVIGDAGVGKSRLVHALMARVEQGQGFVRKIRCFPETSHSPLQPLVDLGERLSGIAPHDSPEIRRMKLGDALALSPLKEDKALFPWLNRLLQLPDDPLQPLPPLESEKVRAEFIGRLADIFLILAERSPVLLIVEDMQWADESTVALLTHLISHAEARPLLLVATARSGWRPPWKDFPVLALAPLSDEDIGTLLSGLDEEMRPALRERIVARAEGIPFFAEELALAGAGGNDLPENLRDLMMVRLDRAGPACQVAQRASVLGREFDVDFLERISTASSGSLDRDLARLEALGLVERMANGGRRFKHALLQAAAYESQTRSSRQEVHRQVARLLESGFRNIVVRTPEVLAHHLTQAGEIEASIPVWREAGWLAESRCAYAEALAHYRSGYALLAQLPESPQRDQLELPLLIRLVRAEQMVDGYGNPNSMSLLDRAVTILEQQGEVSPDLFHMLWGKWEGAGSSRQGFALSFDLANRLLYIANALDDRSLRQQAFFALGGTLFWLGDLAASKDFLERSMALESEDLARPTRNCYGRYMWIYAASYLAWVRCFQNDMEGATATAEMAVARARLYQDDHAIAGALIFAATTCRWSGDIKMCRHHGEEALVLSRRAGSIAYEMADSMLLGWVSVMEGNMAAVEAIEKGVMATRRAMNGLSVMLLGIHAEVLIQVGRTDEARQTALDAIAQSRVGRDLHYLPELFRIVGLCLQRTGDAEGAERFFRRALRIGKKQGAAFFVQKAESCLAQVVAAGNA